MKSVRKTAAEYMYIAAGCFLLAVGLEVFLVPLKLSPGGVSSLGTVFLYFFSIPLSVTNLSFNILLFIAAYKILGRDAVIKSVAGVFFTSAFLAILEYTPAIEVDYFAASLAGGILMGIGVGAVIRCGASTGGSDLAAMMILKYMPYMSVADVIFVLDAVIIMLAGIAFKSVTVSVYSFAALFVAARITDGVITMGNSAKSVFITTEKVDEISALIIDKIKRGVTGIYSKGIYTGTERLMLLCVVSPKELPTLVALVRERDKDAFIIIEDAKKVLGEGFLHDAGL